MEKNIFIFLLWTLTVYYVKCDTHTQSKLKRGKVETSEVEPHPYTISFFTFPKGAASELLEAKRESKRDNQDLSTHKTIKPVVPGTDKKVNKNKKIAASDKENKSSSKVSDAKKVQNDKIDQNIGDKHNKIPEKDIDRGKQKVKSIEPWSLGPLHNAIKIAKHHHVGNTVQAESYQEGSINHPSHTMYPKCHHCPRNSSYEDCVSKATLKKCDSGLNNICFTKSFQSTTRGVIYEMGCADHKKCRKAKAAPCKGELKRCFVCCQFDGCNAVEHRYFQSPETGDDYLGYSAYNKAKKSGQSTWSFLLIVGIPLVAVMLT